MADNVGAALRSLPKFEKNKKNKMKIDFDHWKGVYIADEIFHEYYNGESIISVKKTNTPVWCFWFKLKNL